MQKTIYIKDDEQWLRLVGISKDRGISVSGLIQEAVSGLLSESQFDRIESKLDNIIGSRRAKEDSGPIRDYSSGGNMVADPDENPEVEQAPELEKTVKEATEEKRVQKKQKEIEVKLSAQDKLDGERSKKDTVKKEKIKKVRGKISQDDDDMLKRAQALAIQKRKDFKVPFNPQPKEAK